jgi:hypothetical protein
MWGKIIFFSYQQNCHIAFRILCKTNTIYTTEHNRVYICMFVYMNNGNVHYKSLRILILHYVLYISSHLLFYASIYGRPIYSSHFGHLLVGLKAVRNA